MVSKVNVIQIILYLTFLDLTFLNNRFKDDIEIEDEPRIKISHRDDGYSSLCITNANLDDSGTYKVVANNDNGASVYQTRVDVERKLFY